MNIPAPSIPVETGARLDPELTSRIINTFQPVDIVSEQYKRAFLELITRYPDSFANRYNYALGVHGHLTAQAYVFNPDLGAVALMHHKKLGIWVGFGGHVEPGDADIIATARREASEESGLTDLRLVMDAPFDLDVHGFPAKKDQPDHIHYDARFLFETRQTVFAPNGESTDIQWVKVADLGNYLPMWLANSRIVRGLQARYAP